MQYRGTHHNKRRKLLTVQPVCTTWAANTVALKADDVQLKKVKQNFFLVVHLQHINSAKKLYACCFFLRSLLFCLNVNDRSSNDFLVRIWQLVHGTTLINGIYQPFRSFLLDEGSVILIAKECIDIKTRTPTLAFCDKEFHMKNILLVPKGLWPPPP